MSVDLLMPIVCEDLFDATASFLFRELQPAVFLFGNVGAPMVVHLLHSLRKQHPNHRVEHVAAPVGALLEQCRGAILGRHPA